jgi:trans-4-hydroxy-L-proline dehydratase
MTNRVQVLHKQSVETEPYISAERALLLTEFYKKPEIVQLSKPVQRAKAFEYILANRTIWIGGGELIVGERGPAPQATPTYPELCCHSLDDLDVLSTRDRTPFKVDSATKAAYRETVIPFWGGNSMRNTLFENMSSEWTAAFEAGVFTEFMEQRAPGHAILDDKIYHKGILDFKQDIAESRAALDARTDPLAWEKREELKAMDICCNAIMAFAARHADLARSQATECADPIRTRELLAIGDICDRVPAYPPRTFQEALQSYWFVHLGVVLELNTWDSFNPGRLDQHLIPFYRQDAADGILDRDSAVELLHCFWIKFHNQPAPPKVGITEEQSGTYQDFALINVGGIDSEGNDAANELSEIILEVVGEMHLIQPSACIQLSTKNSNDFLDKTLDIIETGIGQPSVFSTDVILEEMRHAGKTDEDALAGGPSGCVTISAFGKESCTLTGYCNWPKILELALNDGVDPKSGLQIGPRSGAPGTFETFDSIKQAYRAQLEYFIDLKIEGNNIIERLYAHLMPSPFMSVLMDDCIIRATDYHNGGARYNTTYIQGVGLGTTTDALSAIRHHVFDEKSIGLQDLLEAMESNFADNESMRLKLERQSPSYGNDDERADDITQYLFDTYLELLDGRPNTKGGNYRVNLLPTTVHIYFGSVTGASANGRRSGEAVSEGISPSHGADTQGPTAVVKSASRIDHAKTGGTLLNMKFTPSVFRDTGKARVRDLIRTYFTLGGHHIQFNVVDRATLEDAQKHPEEYRDLIVRVAGYSDYFVTIGKDLQNEIIARSDQQFA